MFLKGVLGVKLVFLVQISWGSPFCGFFVFLLFIAFLLVCFVLVVGIGVSALEVEFLRNLQGDWRCGEGFGGEEFFMVVGFSVDYAIVVMLGVLGDKAYKELIGN